jgi:uncharacterized membrane protein YbhN (UPF0104 family)
MADPVVEMAPEPGPPPVPAAQAAQAGSSAPTGSATRIVEPPLPGIVRRPRDVLRLAVAIALAAAILVFATLAVTTASGLEQDLIGAATGLPGVVLSIVQFLGNVGLLIIPLAVSIDLLVRRRPGQMLTALTAAAIAAFTALAIRKAIETFTPGQVLEALTKVLPDGTRTLPLDAALAAVVALLAVAQLSGRTRWQVLSAVIVVSVAATLVLASSLTLVAVVESILLGWMIGLAARYIRGTPSERPDGAAIAAALADANLPLDELIRIEDDSRGRRRYEGIQRIAGSSDSPTRDAGPPTSTSYRIHVLDRDQEGAGLVAYLWRQIRVIRPAARPAYLSLRRAFEHETLVTYAAQSTSAPVRPLVAVTEVGVYAAALAFEHLPSRSLADHDPDTLTDNQLVAIWRAVDTLHSARIAHRGLTANRVHLSADGSPIIVDLRDGEVAASEFAITIDIAELLTTLGAIVGPERSVAAAAQVLNAKRLAAALPLLQPLSMSTTTRRMLRTHKELLKDLRAALDALNPEEPVEQQSIQRFKPRTVISAVGLSFATYIFISQIGSVDVGQLVSTASWTWALVAFALSMLTYVGASLSIIGFTPDRIKAIPTLLAQFATTYYGLFAPGVVSGVAVNTAFLQRSGVYAGVAVASVGVSQISAVVSSVLMLLIFGALAGTGPKASFTPSEGVVLAVGAVVVALIIAISIPPIRRYALDRIRPVFARVVPRLLDVLQNPRALITGFGGNLLMNLAYIFALVACVKAFGGSASIPAIALVFLAGSAVASAVPTPGGVGAVELALTTSLTAAGVDAATALSAVLLYRVCTFWIPVPLGWLSSQWLSRKGLLFG